MDDSLRNAQRSRAAQGSRATVAQRRLAWMAIAVTVVVLGSLGGGSAFASRVSASPVLNIGVNADPALGDPAVVGVFANLASFELAYEPLIHVQPNGKYTPGLALSWRYVPESKKSGLKNKVFELTLRKGARFSDGELVDAAGVKAWFDHFVVTSPTFGGYLGSKPTFTVTGPYTVQIRMSTPNPQVPLILSQVSPWGYVMASNAINTPSLLGQNTYGAGPYMLDASHTVSGDHYAFIPNPHYFDKAAVKYSQVNVKDILDPNTMLQALQAGQIDVAQGDPSTADAARNAGLSVVALPATTVAYNIADRQGQSVKALSDVRVRQALSYALDRKTISQALYGIYARGTSEIVASDASEGKYENYYPYDPAKAKSLLAAAGYPSGFDLTICTINSTASPQFLPTAQAVAKYLDAVGVHTTVSTPANLGAAVLGEQCPLFISLYALRSAQFQLSGFITPSSLINLAFHQPVDQTVNGLYYKGLRATDPSVAWKQMYEHIVTQGELLPVSFYSTIFYYNKSVVKNVNINTARLAVMFPTEFVPAS